jgi:hypothetical protein
VFPKAEPVFPSKDFHYSEVAWSLVKLNYK